MLLFDLLILYLFSCLAVKIRLLIGRLQALALRVDVFDLGFNFWDRASSRLPRIRSGNFLDFIDNLLGSVLGFREE
jgi:hypothetical protein